MSIIQNAVQAVIKTVAEHAPDAWLPGGKADPLIRREHGLIGASVSRIDGPLKVQGKATFAAEFALGNMTYAALAFSTVAKGRIATLDVSEAEAAPGVVLVMTHRNAPRMQPMPLFLTGEKAAGGDNLPIMQDDRVYWNGQPIALVLAQTQEQADHRLRAGQSAGHRARPVHGTATRAGDRRRGSRTGGGAAPGRCGVSHAAPQPQCNRAARGDGGLERRQPAYPRRLPVGDPQRLVARAGVWDRSEAGPRHLAL